MAKQPRTAPQLQPSLVHNTEPSRACVQHQKCSGSVGFVAARFDPFPGLQPIGFWRDPEHPELPDPSGLIDLDWDLEERERVAAVLGSASTYQLGEGCSVCRICGEPNGFLDLSDGTLVWPEGLVHYVADHSVRLSADVVAQLLIEGTATYPLP